MACGHHRVAVLSLKGGVGKTVTAVGLGATLASLRGDRVMAVDANPDRGTLGDKVRLETAATIRDLLNEQGQIRRYADVRAFTTQAAEPPGSAGLRPGPAVSVAFSAEDYCDVARVLEHYYSICITDCGTGLLHSAMAGVLRLADQIVLVSSPSVDGARSASATLDWLDAHGYGDLVSDASWCCRPSGPGARAPSTWTGWSSTSPPAAGPWPGSRTTRTWKRAPRWSWNCSASETADAYLALAALVGDGLAWPRRLTYRSALP